MHPASLDSTVAADLGSSFALGPVRGKESCVSQGDVLIVLCISCIKLNCMIETMQTTYPSLQEQESKPFE